MAENSCVIRVGRLLEIRALAGYRSLADVSAHFGAIAQQIRDLPEVVIVSDWRFCPLMSGEASDEMCAGMTRNNARVLRAAALASHDSPIAMLQFLRVIRESGHAARRLFFDVQEMTSWLSVVLSEPELDALHEFLSWEPSRAQAVAAGDRR